MGNVNEINGALNVNYACFKRKIQICLGIILERLNSKIIDVERLDRNIERSDDTHNWTIKATIRGEVMRELGVLYNSNYYAISEHPGYGGRRGSGLDDEDDMPEIEDEIDGEDAMGTGDSIGMRYLLHSSEICLHYLLNFT